MTRVGAMGILGLLAAPAWAQQPPVQNGRVETRQAADLAREVGALAGAAVEPVWAGWRAAMVGGPRSLCNWYVDDTMAVRGFLASTGGADASVPRIAPPTGPVPIEAGTGLVVLVRLAGGQVERLRTLTDDCPIDAGGRTIHWFDAVSPARSLAYLDTLAELDGVDQLDRAAASGRRSLAQSAVTAIALHADAGADAILGRLAAPGADPGLRRHAIGQLGAYRGRHGFDTLRRLLGSEANAAVRRTLVTALAQTGQPLAADTLLELARADADARLRGEAAYQYLRLTRDAGVPTMLTLLEREADAAVKRRALQGLFALPDAAGVPHLVALARTSTDQTVRREAVTLLGRTKDPRAIAYLTELLGGRR